jgi:hypothetical protein
LGYLEAKAAIQSGKDTIQPESKTATRSESKTAISSENFLGLKKKRGQHWRWPLVRDL